MQRAVLSPFARKTRGDIGVDSGTDICLIGREVTRPQPKKTAISGSSTGPGWTLLGGHRPPPRDDAAVGQPQEADPLPYSGAVTFTSGPVLSVALPPQPVLRIGDGDSPPCHRVCLKQALTPHQSSGPVPKPPDLMGVPMAYHDHGKVFRKARATSFPFHQPYNCATPRDLTTQR